MNFIIKIMMLLSLPLSVVLMKAEEIIIRSAQPKDFPILALLNKQVIREDFGTIITSGYPNSPIAQNPVLLDEYLNTMHECYKDLFNEEKNLLQDANLLLLVAVDQQEPEKILGFCFSQKEDVQVCIRLLLINKNYRNRGIGRALITQTIKSYNDITSCVLRTFSHGNEEVQAFYEKYGFTSDKKAEPSRARVTEYSDTITFILYQKNI